MRGNEGSVCCDLSLVPCDLCLDQVIRPRRRRAASAARRCSRRGRAPAGYCDGLIKAQGPSHNNATVRREFRAIVAPSLSNTLNEAPTESNPLPKTRPARHSAPPDTQPTSSGCHLVALSPQHPECDQSPSTGCREDAEPLPLHVRSIRSSRIALSTRHS